MGADENGEVWTIGRLLEWTAEYFTGKGIDTGRLDAEVLLAASLGVDRVHLYTHYDKPLNDDERGQFRGWVRRRAAREPVAHILGTKEFFSRDFEVSRDVLVPRPETEHLVERVLEWCSSEGISAPRILDVGTGSGNIAVTLALELPEARVVATDISEAALAVARRNAEAHGVLERCELVAGDLWSSVEGTFAVVVSNPPYIPSEERQQLQPEVRDYEPPVALFGGDDGLHVIDQLCAAVGDYLDSPGLFACEIDPLQKERVVAALEGAGGWSKIGVVHDLQGLDRAVFAQR